MDQDNMLIICRVCGRKTLMHNMRPDKDGEHMICVDCYRKQNGVSSTVKNIFGSAPVGSTATAPVAKKSKGNEKEKTHRYVCPNCKYSFTRKASQPAEKCPYCGNTDLIMDEGIAADKLIKESTDKKYEW